MKVRSESPKLYPFQCPGVKNWNQVPFETRRAILYGTDAGLCNYDLQYSYIVDYDLKKIAQTLCCTERVAALPSDGKKKIVEKK